MQTATYRVPPPPTPMTAPDPLRASVSHLLSRAYGLPCSTAAQAFVQLVQPTSRFQLALDALLPILDSRGQLEQRILVSYILFSLYSPHPIAINPFKSALFATFNKERDAAVRMAGSGGLSENEQLVWVLWKILKGDGNDLGPYSPSTLARSPLPPKLRALNLMLDSDGQFADPLEQFVGESAQSADTRKDTPRQSAPIVLNVQQEAQVTPEEDEKNETVSHAMSLLLVARERVLTLSEQRFLNPLIRELTSPPILTSVDLPPLISFNPTLAHPILVALLANAPSTANPQGPFTYLDVLQQLPPTLPTFDIFGRLLRDETPITDVTTGGKTTIADLVRSEALGGFIHESIEWLEKAEREEREGLISDDRFSKGVQNLCRFYNSLIKFSIVDPSSDADSAEMMHFTLRNSRFEDANLLYRHLAMGKF
ncbi:hypothetical protein JAAARDRAFT_141358 [Jaapia argillacea MUCL 33604]|uniref:Uncharacterized protein n=1 Tax=Jaapia argillacea MUCL 33604 TaxID=933084 RepID=A0A067PAB5_9AGAM|nr:hypothetical protein JAAARDRAFT_141358 [Jaapia argillacea MUCL 33604]